MLHLAMMIALASPLPTAPSVSGPSEAVMGQTVTVRGAMQNAKMGAMVLWDGGSAWIDLPEWPKALLGQIVVVKGEVIKRSDLPVFHADPNEPIVAGILTPPHIDLKTAAIRYLVKPSVVIVQPDRTFVVPEDGAEDDEDDEATTPLMSIEPTP